MTICANRATALERACVAAGGTAEECAGFAASFSEECEVWLASIDDWHEMQRVAPPRPFVRGDSNRDGRVDIGDPVNTLNGIFQGSGSAFDVVCADRLDANDDGVVDISDSVFTLRWLFAGGNVPPAPGPVEPGHDATHDVGVCYE